MNKNELLEFEQLEINSGSLKKTFKGKNRTILEKKLEKFINDDTHKNINITFLACWWMNKGKGRYNLYYHL